MKKPKLQTYICSLNREKRERNVFCQKILLYKMEAYSMQEALGMAVIEARGTSGDYQISSFLCRKLEETEEIKLDRK